MHTPKVSVIVPTYNGAYYLGDAIQSVLEQTYSNFELIVVNDASPDNTTEVVKQFVDPRLKYIVFEENKGVGQARYAGVQASNGEIIALLDQDDFYHPEKLEAHVAFLGSNPDIGFTYNARFELNYSSNTIRDLWRPPSNMSLADLVLWFPISPSDVVFRREWALKIKWLGQRQGAEIAQFGHLFLEGCKFGFVNRALNYRRYHSGRVIKNVSSTCDDEISNQVQIFTDPRFSPDLLALRNIAHTNLYVYWAYRAFAQDETALGCKFIKNAIELKPSVVDGMPSELVDQFLINCIDDENLDHEALLRKIFNQFPPEVPIVSEQYNWTVAEGYLLKGARAVIWGRYEDGYRHFERAKSLGAYVDEYFLKTLTHKLLDYEKEFGSDSVQSILHVFSSLLRNFSGGAKVRMLIGNYFVSRAFRHYYADQFADALRMAIRAICKDPKYLANRGVLSIMGRSTLKLLYS